MRVATVLLAILQSSNAAGSFVSKKVQILVPHNIHHHTHTKYHFIAVPVERASNHSDAPSTARPAIMIPVMPVIPLAPGLTRNASATPAPGTQPTNSSQNAGQQPNFQMAGMQPVPTQQGFAPNFFQQTQPPNFQQPAQQPNFQGSQNNFLQPAQQPNFFAQGPQNNFQQPAQQPGFQQPGPPNNQQMGQLLQYERQWPQQKQSYNPNAEYLSDYEYNDLSARSSRNQIIRSDRDPLQPLPPMKFKTIINVKETKRIPIKQFLDLSKYLMKEPAKRIKVEVFPEKNQHVKQTQKIAAQWHELQESLKANPFPGMTREEIDFDPESAASQPEWTALKQMLESQIQQDFPGLKVQAELKPVAVGSREGIERRERKNSRQEDPSSSSPYDLQHVGYIVIGHNNQQHFLALPDKSTPSTT